MSSLKSRLAARRSMRAQGILFGGKAGASAIGGTSMAGVSGSGFNMGGLQNMFGSGGLSSFFGNFGPSQTAGVRNQATGKFEMANVTGGGGFSAIGAGLGALCNGLPR